MKKKGVIGTIMSLLSLLTLTGIFLAVLSQFGGDVGALFQWLLDTAWGIVTSVRDSVSSWETFQRLF